MRARLIMLVVATGLANILPASEQLYLTGIIEVGAYQRAVVMEHPSLCSYLLIPGKKVAGLKLLEVNSQTASVRLQRDSEEFILAMPSLGKANAPLAGYLAGGTLPPDYSGPWPAGYEPELIRLHRAGLLRGDAPITMEQGNKASAKYLGAVRNYMKTLSEEEREPFLNVLRHYAGEPTVASDNTTISGTAAPPGKTDSILDRSEAELLQRVLSSPPPAEGALVGTPGDIVMLRRLWRHQTNPAVLRRIDQEIMGYAANPATEQSVLATF